MKIQILLFLSFCFSTVTFSQVGLLSSNNKESPKSISSDTANFGLAPIRKSESSVSIIKPPDTTVIIHRYIDNGALLDNLKQNLRNATKNNADSVSRYKQLIAAEQAKQKDLNNLLLTLLKSNYYKTYNIFKLKLDSLKNSNESFQKALFESNFLTRHYPIDTSSHIIEFDKFTREMSKVYANLEFLQLENDRNRELILTASKKLDDTKLPKDTITDLIKVNSTLEQAWNDLSLDTSILAGKLVSDTTKYTTIQSSLNTVLKSYIKEKKKAEGDQSKTSDFGAFPLLSSILGKKETIPQLQLYGSYTQKGIGKTFEGNIGLSFAPTSAPDTANLYTVFIPSASKFLLHSNFEWSFLPAGNKINDSSQVNLLGIRFDVAFASKNLVFDTVKVNRTISSSMLYAKAGIEFGVIPKRLSIYANLNSVTILDKNDEFVAGTGVDSKILGYVDCGAKFFLDPTPNSKIDDKLFIFANINCIVNVGDVKRVTKTNDAVIPTLQFGIVKSLGKF